VEKRRREGRPDNLRKGKEKIREENEGRRLYGRHHVQAAERGVQRGAGKKVARSVEKRHLLNLPSILRKPLVNNTEGCRKRSRENRPAPRDRGVSWGEKDSNWSEILKAAMAH